MTNGQNVVSSPQLSFGGLMRSEVIKARGLRSIRWLLIVAAVLPVVSALMTALVGNTDAVDMGDAALSAVADLAWMPLLVVMLVGTVVATAEYERGSLQTTFAVAPRRIAVVLAKVTVVAVAVAATLLVSVVVAFLVAAVVFGDGAVGAIGRLEVVRVLVGTALYGAASAVIAASIGLLVRSSIAGIAATLGFLYVLPSLLQALSVEAVTAVARTLPGPASTPLDTPGLQPDQLPFAVALVAVIGWTLLVVALACVVVRRRDV